MYMQKLPEQEIKESFFINPLKKGSMIEFLTSSGTFF